MHTDDITAALDLAQERLDQGAGLRGTGFWRAVAAVKASPDLVERFADRIAEIDRNAFERWALLTIPIGVGTALAVLATIVGLVVIGVGYGFDAPGNGLALVLGTGILIVATHGLGHLAVGAISGITFTHWFVGTLGRPQPGVKVDYATYLRTPAAGRARMHAAGAVVTKALPFLLLGAAWGMEAPAWAWWVLTLIGVVSVVTDVLWSTKKSDWKKYLRERRYVSE